MCAHECESRLETRKRGEGTGCSVQPGAGMSIVVETTHGLKKLLSCKNYTVPTESTKGALTRSYRGACNERAKQSAKCTHLWCCGRAGSPLVAAPTPQGGRTSLDTPPAHGTEDPPKVLDGTRNKLPAQWIHTGSGHRQTCVMLNTHLKQQKLTHKSTRAYVRLPWARKKEGFESTLCKTSRIMVRQT